MSGHEHCNEHADGACSMSAAASSAVLGLGAPVLLLAGIAGLAIPWAVHRSGRVPPHGRAGASIRALGAGIVLGIALLHCLPEAAAALGCVGWGNDYPWAFLIAAAAAVASALLEGCLLEAFGVGAHCGKGPATAAAAVCGGGSGGGETGKGAARMPRVLHAPRPESTAHASSDLASAEAGAAAAAAPALPAAAADAADAAAPAFLLPLTSATVRAHEHGGPGCPPPAFHAAAIAVLEVGICLHSLVVGFALGSSRSGCDALPLLAAFAVHQLLEGAAVGSCLADSSLARPAVLASAAVTALSAPVGVVVGLAARRWARHGLAGQAMTGAADALAAGLLLHVGLADLLASTAGVGLRGEAGAPTRGRLLAAHALFGASLVTGLALAAGLAVWG